MEVLSFFWIEVIFRPMLNTLVFLYVILFHNFGLAILGFTAVVRIGMFPLTVKQLNTTRAMSGLQPKLEQVKRKYAKDRRRLNQETMKVYKEQGLNPLGCLGPFVIQFPIWIGLYQAILHTIPATAEGLVELSQHLYSWLPGLNTAIPIKSEFLWLQLESPDPTRVVLPAIVGVTTWVMQKMTMTSSGSSQQQSTNTMMLWLFPAMLAFWTLQFPSGLAIYWVASNLIGIAVQYRIMGWGGLFRSASPPAQQAASSDETDSEPIKETENDGDSRDERSNGRGSSRSSPENTGRRPRRRRNRRR